MRIFEEVLADSVSLDAAGTATHSAIIDLSHLVGYAIHAKWNKVGGTLGGSIKTQKSNDGSYWIDVTTQAIGDASGAKEFEPTTEVFYKYVKVTTTLTGGSATLYINSYAKGV